MHRGEGELIRASDAQIGAGRDREPRPPAFLGFAFTTTVPHCRRLSDAVDPPEAKSLMAEARDPIAAGTASTPITTRRPITPNWSKRPTCRKATRIPPHKEWAGKIAIDETDDEWLSALFAYYGDERGRELVTTIVATLDPVIADGHLALARSVGAGEYWLALNNFLPLTLNVKMSGAPTDFWLIDPVPLIFGSVGINTLAPHLNTAKLAGNFVLSREAKTFMTHKGRLPTRQDVPTNPPEVGAMLRQMKIMPVVFHGTDKRKWQKTYNALFKSR